MKGQRANDRRQLRVKHGFPASDGNDLRAEQVELFRNDFGLCGRERRLLAPGRFPKITDGAPIIAGVEDLQVDVNQAVPQKRLREPKPLS